MSTRPVIACTLAALLAFGPAGAAEPPRHAAGGEPSPEHMLQQLAPGHEWIDVEIDQRRFSLLYRPAMGSPPLGTLLLLPDPGLADGWLVQARTLSDYLPEHGWAVLAVAPPPLPPTAVPKRTLPVLTTLGEQPSGGANPTAVADARVTTADSSAAAATTEPAFAERMQQRLALGWNELRQRHQGQQQVVVGFGRAAVWAAALAGQHGPDTALLLIDPQPDPLAPAALPAQLAELKEQAVIDLYHHPLPAYPEAEPDARARRLEAARLGLSRYRQSRLPGVFRGWQVEAPRLARQARGMLQRVLLDPAAASEAAVETPPAALEQTPPGRPPAMPRR